MKPQELKQLINDLELLQDQFTEVANKLSGTNEGAQLKSNIFVVDKFVLPSLKRTLILMN